MEEAVKFLWTMLKEALLLLASLGGEAAVWFGRLLAPENLKQGWHAAEKSCAVALAWFDEVGVENLGAAAWAWFDEVGVENLGAAAWAWFVGRPYLVAAVAVYVMYGFGLCGWFGMVKMMKAPGMGFMIPRIIFQTFPKWYFRIFRPR